MYAGSCFCICFCLFVVCCLWLVPSQNRPQSLGVPGIPFVKNCKRNLEVPGLDNDRYQRFGQTQVAISHPGGDMLTMLFLFGGREGTWLFDPFEGPKYTRSLFLVNSERGPPGWKKQKDFKSNEPCFLRCGKRTSSNFVAVGTLSFSEGPLFKFRSSLSAFSVLCLARLKFGSIILSEHKEGFFYPSRPVKKNM